MELKHLRYFIALADDLDVARTAKHVGLSASVLMKHLSDLEESLGCSLFRRHGANASVSLSAAGQVFYQRAKDLLASAAAAAGEVRAAAAAMASQIKLGHSERWCLDRYAPALQQFSKTCPGLRVHPQELIPSELPGALRRGELDLALMEHVDVGLRIEFKVRRIEALPMQIVLPVTHSLAKRAKLALRELEEEVWVGWEERIFPGRRHLLLEASRAAGFVPCIAQDADSEFMMYDIVAGGTAIGYVGHAPVDALPKGVTLVTLSPATMEHALFAVWRKDADNLAQLEQLGAALLAAAPKKAKRG